MLDFEAVDRVASLVGHRITERHLFELALTAPGADEANYDGNRMLARQGALAMELALTHHLATQGLHYALVNQMVKAAKTRVVRETVAKEKGLTQLLRLSPRQKDGPASPTTLRSAIDALLGAVFEDSAFCLRTVKNAALRLGVLTPHDLLVDPRCLEISEQFEFGHLDVVDSFLDLDKVGIADKEIEYTPSPASGFDDEITQPSPSNVNARGQAPEPGQTLSLEREATCNKQASTGETSNKAISSKPSRPIEKVGDSSRIRKRNVNPRQRCFLEQELSPKNIAQLQELAGIDRVGADLQVEVVTRLALAINGTSSNSYLRALLDGYSRKEDSRSQLGSTDFLQMSLQDRFRRILVLDEQLAFHGFLRTFHVYKLVSDFMCEHQDTQGSFLITSIESAASATPKSPGNPLVRAQAQLHEAMMKSIFPGLPKGGSLYNQKYEDIKHMRRHGCRLGQIASRFGEGLFALVPFHGTPIDPLIGLFGHACRTFSDGRWASFIELLSTHQGESIRSTCRDYQSMVEQLFCGTLQACGRTTFVEPETAQLPDRPICPQVN